MEASGLSPDAFNYNHPAACQPGQDHNTVHAPSPNACGWECHNSLPFPTLIVDVEMPAAAHQEMALVIEGAVNIAFSTNNDMDMGMDMDVDMNMPADLPADIWIDEDMLMEMEEEQTPEPESASIAAEDADMQAFPDNNVNNTWGLDLFIADVAQLQGQASGAAENAAGGGSGGGVGSTAAEMLAMTTGVPVTAGWLGDPDAQYGVARSGLGWNEEVEVVPEVDMEDDDAWWMDGGALE